MHDASALYTIVDGAEAPVIEAGLTMISTLPAMVDAGHAADITVKYIRESLAYTRVVTFDSDSLIDYRSSRPRAHFDGRSFEIEAMPEIGLDLVHDDAGAPFLLLHGPEPDTRWQAVANALVELCESFDVKEVVSIRAVPAEVPHTRPISILPHANAVARENESWPPPESEPLELPASFSAFSESVLNMAGIASRGFVAQIPHYLTGTSFPAGALALLRRVSAHAGLDMPLVDLGDIAAVASRLLESDMADNPELRTHVRALEGAYDARSSDEEQRVRTLIDTPTANELAESFERYLAQHEDPDSGR